MIIPAANARHLMLSDDVVDAVRRDAFHVWTTRTIDEGLERLTGRSAGGIHRLVEDRLRGFAERLRTFASHDGSVGVATPGTRA